MGCLSRSGPVILKEDDHAKKIGTVPLPLDYNIVVRSSCYCDLKVLQNTASVNFKKHTFNNPAIVVPGKRNHIFSNMQGKATREVKAEFPDTTMNIKAE